MIIEIEKQYTLTDEDYKNIKEKCVFISNKDVIDIYLDSNDYKLFSTLNRARIRNGKPELKMKTYDRVKKIKKSLEYDNLKEINIELEKMGLNFEELNEVLEVITHREKYNLEFEGFNFTVDIDRYKYGERYEIELTFDDDDDGIDSGKLIDDFRNHLGLKGKQNLGIGKVSTCAKHENKDIYEKILKIDNKIYS